jgi:hypothetical protein
MCTFCPIIHNMQWRKRQRSATNNQITIFASSDWQITGGSCSCWDPVVLTVAARLQTTLLVSLFGLQKGIKIMMKGRESSYTDWGKPRKWLTKSLTDELQKLNRSGVTNDNQWRGVTVWYSGVVVGAPTGQVTAFRMWNTEFTPFYTKWLTTQSEHSGDISRQRNASSVTCIRRSELQNRKCIHRVINSQFYI